MVTIASLWLAILLSAIVVMIASFLVWAVLPYHKSDYKALPDEKAVREAFSALSLPPGQYNLPHMSSREEILRPEVRLRFEAEPTGFITIVPRGLPSMGKGVLYSWLYYLSVTVVIAFLVSGTVPADASYVTVFRVTGTIAWLAFAAGGVPSAIWFGRPWKDVGKQVLDAFMSSLTNRPLSS
ncbi:MAG: hypothetical protein P8X82_03055 [Gemmatimonadales bacterium]